MIGSIFQLSCDRTSFYWFKIGSSSSKRMTTIIFLDFNKAFDSTDRRAISIVLSKYGVSELLIANVMQFYIGTTAHKNTEIFFSNFWCSSRSHTGTFPLHHPT